MDTPAQTLDAEATLLPSGAGAEPRPGRDDAAAEGLGPGTELGRYVVLRRLGSGGMGTVWLAYDPELDRRVALKLLRGPTGSADPLVLLREAQAMAKLQHPNVVTVHDVGEHRGRIYVAMAFIEGCTLTAWSRAGRRGWREVVEVFSSAGQGLRAAHERGLIHRDFKPDNVMVSDEGQVLVMDFGLARASTGATSEGPSVELRSFRGSVIDAATVGRLVGTPAYMAPEQVAAEELGPAVDQFAFCVALWEGVCGQRPFEGTLISELYGNICEGRIRPPPAGARMPGWLRRVLQRGLAADPEARWPSMARLLHALDRGRRRWRWQVGLAASAGLAVAAGSVWAWRLQQAQEQREAMAACEAEGAAIDEVWNDQAQERVRSGLLATRAHFAPKSLDTLIPWLDDYRDAWSRGRTEACVHATIEHSWDEAQLDRSAWCFEDRRLQLEATVEQLATLEPAAARRAVRIASYLDPVATCLDPNPLQRLPAPPLEMRDEIRAIRAVLSKSDQLRHAGMYAEALEQARRARERAEALGWSPLLALARFIEGRCSMQVGRYREAEALLAQAYFQAQDTGSIEVAFRAARSLVTTLTRAQRYREAELWSRHANVLAATLEDPSGLDAAEGHYLLLSVYEGLGDHEAAAKEGEAALALRTEALGADHPITAAVERNLARIRLAQGRPAEALELLERAHLVWQDAVDPEHPYVAELAFLRGKAQWAMGHVDEALALLAEGVAVLERVMGAEHPATLESLDEWGGVLLALGRLDEAESMLARVMELRLARHGPRHPLVAESLLSMASVDRARGREALALQRSADALEILEGSLEPEGPQLLAAMERVAELYRALGRHDEAIERRREALARREAALGSHHRQLMRPLVELGDVYWEAGRLDQAHRSHARARAIGGQRGGPADVTLVPSLTGLAEVTLAEGDARAAQRLAEHAVEIVEREDAGPRLASAAHFVL
ncbi:MAG: serine/threonine protein kinase, partial [Myxococcales bacterium]|nr:serine/threonine protein kinase [Myxococcales bacterium]